MLRYKKKSHRIDFESKEVLEHFRKIYDMSLNKPKSNANEFEYEVKVYDRRWLDSEEE